MIYAAIVFVVTAFLIRRECEVIWAIYSAITSWVTTPAEVIVSTRISRAWHSEKPYKTPRYIAAAKIDDPSGRSIVVKKLTITNKLHSACRTWVSEHKPGDRIEVAHPPNRPDLGVLIPVSELWFQMAWRVLYVVVIIAASIFIVL